ncbi:MAG: FMN-binding negative transcriptional regulator [Verrucomicrobia bacterium]|nr:FMN-binding negative transcriptional regulator [Verrucomicrobiota bacterium]
MYNPPHFTETRPEILHALIAAHPLGTLVTLGSTGLDANHIPFEFDPAPTAAAPHGTLLAHVARANPLWRDHSATTEALVVFQGPQSYVTPTWYTETKPATGKVVPTWNYCTVHAHGPLRVIDDPAWLLALVTRLTARHECGRPAPWAVADAPADFVAKQLAAIVGIEIPITRLAGKWKVSQNRPAADRAGIVAGLAAEGAGESAAMARLVRDFGTPKPAP